MLNKAVLKGSIAPILIVLSLFLLRWYHGVLLFHTMSEMFSVIVGILMLVVVWNTRQFTHNNFLIYFGIGYFWVYTRILEACLVLSAPVFLKNPLIFSPP